MRLANKVALITGAARGIGRGIARRFAREGADLIIVDRDKQAGEETAAEIAREFGVATVFKAANLGYEDQACAVVEASANEFGRLDILVNNAQGFNGLAPLLEKTTGEFDYSLRTGLYASFWTMKTA